MAEIEVKKDFERQLTVITVKGNVSGPDIASTIVAHNKEQVTRLILWDLSQADIPSLPVEEIQGFVKTTTQFTETRQGGRTAVVAPSDLGFGLARIFDALQEINHSPVAHMSFRDKESALRWLLE